MKTHNRNLQWFTHLHIYRLSLAIGDAYHLIDKIKAGDAYKEFFYNDDERPGQKEGFINEVNVVLQNNIDDIIGKTVKCFTLNNGGMGWFPIFDSMSKNEEIEGYFIDVAGAKCALWADRPTCFFSKEHINLLNTMISESLKNKPLFNLSFPSKKIMFMETHDEVQFNTQEKDKVDYSKPTNEVFNQLIKINDNSKNTFNFLVDNLSSDKFEVYKVESLIKDIDWYAAYYAKYHLDEKNIYERKTTTKENKENFDKWLSGQPLAREIKEIHRITNFDLSEATIEDLKWNVEQHGFLHGYYLKAI